MTTLETRAEIIADQGNRLVRGGHRWEKLRQAALRELRAAVAEAQSEMLSSARHAGPKP